MNLPGLPNVLVRKVCEYLWWAEVMAVKSVSHECYAKLVGSKQLDVVAILRQQLVQTTGSVSNAATALRLLAESGNQLTGSYVLQAMFGGMACPWRDTVGDIDALVFSKRPVPEDYLEQADYVSPGGAYEQEPAHALLAWYERNEHKGSFNTVTRLGPRGGLAPSSLVLGEYLPWKTPLSFTHVGRETGRNSVDARCFDKAEYNYSSLADFVAREADFGFCQVLFDGTQLRVRDWQAVWTRSAKMRARDFHLLPYYEWGVQGADIMNHFFGRCEKYRARGFTIETDLPASAAQRKILNDEIIIERNLQLVYLYPYDEGVPRKTVSPHILLSYDRWVASGFRGRWSLSDAQDELDEPADENNNEPRLFTTLPRLADQIEDKRDDRARYRASQQQHHLRRAKHKCLVKKNKMK